MQELTRLLRKHNSVEGERPDTFSEAAQVTLEASLSGSAHLPAGVMWSSLLARLPPFTQSKVFSPPNPAEPISLFHQFLQQLVMRDDVLFGHLSVLCSIKLGDQLISTFLIFF